MSYRIGTQIRIAALALATVLISCTAFAANSVHACNMGPQQPDSAAWIHASDNAPKDCNSGPIPMWVTRAQVHVDKGNYVFTADPPCSANPRSQLAILVQKVATKAYGTTLGKWAGDLSDLVGRPIEAQIKQTGGDLSKIIVPPSARVAACGLAVAVVPVDAQVIGYRLQSWSNDTGTSGCSAGQDCGNGWSKFMPPQVQKSDGIQVVSAEFRNWNSDWDRVGIMFVFFRTNQAPLQEM